MAEKTITIRVDDELHKSIKVLIAKRGIKLKDYVTGLIKDDLAKEAAEQKNMSVRDYNRIHRRQKCD